MIPARCRGTSDQCLYAFTRRMTNWPMQLAGSDQSGIDALEPAGFHAPDIIQYEAIAATKVFDERLSQLAMEQAAV